VGVILKARERGLVEAVYPLLLALRKAGLWLSDALVADVLQQAGEA
jgi:predicted nucleic acid-binding protein